MTAAHAPQGAAGRRPYRSARRQQQAAETRDAVLAAACRLFTERGWAATGMREVAADAGVAVETVYANFRSKADLLRCAIDVAVVGDTAEVPLVDRPEFTVLAEGDVAARAAAAARLNARINRRTAGLHQALAHAAGADTALTERRRENEERRRISVRQAAEMVAGRPVTEQECDGIWAVAGTEVYLLLTEIRGWSDEQYETWLADTILRLLGEPQSPEPEQKKGSRR